ncbi:hypothetical protein BH09MYX1_BH09MYX1_27030 [soil metagenome]
MKRFSFAFFTLPISASDATATAAPPQAERAPDAPPKKEEPPRPRKAR